MMGVGKKPRPLPSMKGVRYGMVRLFISIPSMDRKHERTAKYIKHHHGDYEDPTCFHDGKVYNVGDGAYITTRKTSL